MQARVGELLRETAAGTVLPAYRRLASDQVWHKAGGEVVTAVDEEAERLLTAGLRGLLPGAAVVGEEAVAARPALRDRLADPAPVWVVDPIDGTANFVAGTGPFFMLVALRRAGVTEAAWLYDPLADELWHAQYGGGAFRDHTPVQAAARPADRALRGALSSRWLPRPLAGLAQKAGLTALPGLRCAGREYPDIVSGAQDFALFWRTHPWDHLPGALLLTEAGGVLAHLDASAYDPTGHRRGLLAASDGGTWGRVAAALSGQ